MSENTKRQPSVGSEKWSAQIRSTAKRVAKEIDTAYMKLAEVLYTVWDTPINGDPEQPPVFTAWGYQSFHEYAEHELSLQRRKAEFLRRIYYILHVELEAMDTQMRERVAALGFSKVRELVGVLTLDNVQEWVERAEQSTYAELSHLIKVYREKQRIAKKQAEVDGGEVEPVSVPDEQKEVWERFMLFPDQHAIVQEALTAAAAITGSASKNHNLTMICMDYLATNGAAPPGTQAFRNYLANLEGIFNVRFMVVDHKVQPQELLYGVQALEDLAKSHGTDITTEEDAA